MKKTQIKELLSNIKTTFMSFFAIMLFVALSVGVFTGISWTAPALQNSAETVFEDGNLYDFEIQFPNGMSDADIKNIEALEGTEAVETAYSSFQMIQLEEKSSVAKVMSITENMNMFVAVDGEIPDKKGEIALDVRWAKDNGIEVGDTVKFKHDGKKTDKDGMKFLRAGKYKVTALVKDSAYIANSKSSYGMATIGSSGYIQCLAYVDDASFDKSAYPGYMQVFIRNSELRDYSTFDPEYKQISGEIAGELESLGASLAEERYNELREEAQKKIDDAEKKLEEYAAKLKQAEKQIADGEKKLKEGKKQYTAGVKKLEEGKEEYAAGVKELENSYSLLTSKQAEYDLAKIKYDEAVEIKNLLVDFCKSAENGTLTYGQASEVYDEIENIEEQFDSKMTQYEEFFNMKQQFDEFLRETGVTDSTLENYENQIFSESQLAAADSYLQEIYDTTDKIVQKVDEAGSILTTAAAELADGWAEYNAGAEKLKKAELQIENGEKELEKAKKQIEAGEKKLEKGKKQIEDGEKLLAQKKTELAEAKIKYEANVEKLEKKRGNIDKIKKYEWIVLTRQENGGVLVVDKFGGITDNMRYSIAMLFIIIGLLVSYSSVSRIVHDQIISIGTKKALGLRKKEITLSYLAYSGIAVIIGAAIGLILGTFVIEQFISNVLGMKFIMGAYAPYFSFGEAVILIVIELVMILITTWLACGSVLKQQAVLLLKGPQPPSAKQHFYEKLKIWERLSLFAKTVINNCMNDRRRVLGTIIGVAGCTALIVTAITVNNNVQKSFERQYEEVFKYDSFVRVSAANKEKSQQIGSLLTKEDMPHTHVYTTMYKMVQPDGKQTTVTVKVPFDEKGFSKLVHLEPFRSGNSDKKYDDGVWIGAAHAAHMDAEVGDSIEISDASGAKYTFTIEGFFDHYLLTNQIVISEQAYEKVFGTDIKANGYLVDSQKQTAEEMKAFFADNGISASVKDEYRNSYEIFSEFAQIAGVIIIIYVVLSVLMAIIVLYDLYSVFIEEKKRELIVLMINGFSQKEARQYIYRDTVVLTVIGILAGIIFGIVMGNITLLSIEPDTAYFVKGIDWAACGIGAVTSGVLASALCMLALRKIKHFKLTDINKM